MKCVYVKQRYVRMYLLSMLCCMYIGMGLECHNVCGNS